MPGRLQPGKIFADQDMLKTTSLVGADQVLATLITRPYEPLSFPTSFYKIFLKDQYFWPNDQGFFIHNFFLKKIQNFFATFW